MPLFVFSTILEYNREFEIEAATYEDAVRELENSVQTVYLDVQPGDTSISHFDLIEEVAD